MILNKQFIIWLSPFSGGLHDSLKWEVFELSYHPYVFFKAINLLDLAGKIQMDLKWH
jgi:hypothetical protein